MDKNVQKEEGISLMDIVRLLLSKIKLLILLVIIGGFIGGCFSVWQTKDVKYYGSQIRFYVNPENPTMSADGSGLNTSGSEYGVYGAYGEHIMDNMVKLLNEDAFAEEMLLRSQNTDELSDNEKALYKYLPMKDVWTGETETALAAKLNAAIDAAIPEVQKIIEAEEALLDAQSTYLSAISTYTTAMDELDDAWGKAFPGPESSFDEVKYSKLTEEELQKHPTLVEAYSKASRANSDLTIALSNVNGGNIALSNAQKSAQASRSKVLDLWSETARYKGMHSKFAAATHFSFLLSNEDREDANKFARSFIYASISVYGDANKEFANEVYDIVKEVVPEYVEANMAIPAGYTGTNCQRISRNDNVRQTNVGYTRSQAIKSAFLMAVAVGVIACVAIIIVDRSDKRLRDCDVITREFQVPILGIVPTIDMDNIPTKKGAANKQNKEEK
ncbi:MAG: hypothetical protein IJY21_01735 [Clostridia bacterium]|nr:hypothetical protein [Clostridia bacterium]